MRSQAVETTQALHARRRQDKQREKIERWSTEKRREDGGETGREKREASLLVPESIVFQRKKRAGVVAKTQEGNQREWA